MKVSVYAAQTIISYVVLTFIGYFIIGLSLAVLPVFIHHDLGFNTVIAGGVISLQYITTLVFRGYSGKIVDTKGPKPVVKVSMINFGFSGILLIIAYFFRENTHLCLIILVLTRLLTGCAEGMVGASPINWAILATSPRHTATAISYNGVASYGGLALGAPIGVYIIKFGDFYYLGGLILILSLIGLFHAMRKNNLHEKKQGVSQSFLKVLKYVAPFGICLGLGGLGFGTISTFMTLYYEYFHWANGALCLSVFGVMFIVARLLFSKTINRYGGVNIALISLVVESIGLFLISLSTTPFLTIIGAGITGLGFSLVFPALGVEAMKTVSAQNKGSALAGYGLFIDLSLGITGPLIGFIAAQFSMKSIFPFAMSLVLIGLFITLYLKYRTKTV